MRDAGSRSDAWVVKGIYSILVPVWLLAVLLPVLGEAPHLLDLVSQARGTLPSLTGLWTSHDVEQARDVPEFALDLRSDGVFALKVVFPQPRGKRVYARGRYRISGGHLVLVARGRKFIWRMRQQRNDLVLASGQGDEIRLRKREAPRRQHASRCDALRSTS